MAPDDVPVLVNRTNETESVFGVDDEHSGRGAGDTWD